MNAGPPPIDATDLPRAGFWRRLFSIMIDSIIVMLPFQVLAVVLFAMTVGTVQMNSGFYSYCVDGKNIPQGLEPPPPHDSNAMRVCRTSLLGAATGATLTVARVTREGNTTTTVSQTYMLDKDGTPIRGTSIDWIFNLAFLVYVVAMVCKTGKTLGARLVGVRVIDVANPGAAGVPIGKTIIRYLAMLIGAAPALALLIFQYVTTGGGADAMFTGRFFEWFTYAGLLFGLWTVVLTVQIARKTDPLYDKLAGTAVVKA